MICYQPFDIVFASFPFEEDKSITKDRPVLIVSHRRADGCYKAAKITSSEAPWRMPIAGGPPANLEHLSWLDILRTEYIHESVILHGIGRLAASDISAFKKYAVGRKKP